MVRIQIQLDPARHREIKRRAKRLGVSASEVIRRCVDAHLEVDISKRHDEQARRAIAVTGKYTESAPATNVSAEHDCRFQIADFRLQIGCWNRFLEHAVRARS